MANQGFRNSDILPYSATKFAYKGAVKSSEEECREKFACRGDNYCMGRGTGGILSQKLRLDKSFSLSKLQPLVNDTFGNTFIGDFSGSNNTRGSNNTFIGNEAGSLNTFGNDNIIIGSSAQLSTSTDSGKLAIGTSSIKNLIVGDFENNNVGVCLKTTLPVNYGGGEGCLFIDSVTVKPTSKPNGGNGGGLLYVDNDALKFMNSKGVEIELTKFSNNSESIKDDDELSVVLDSRLKQIQLASDKAIRTSQDTAESSAEMGVELMDEIKQIKADNLSALNEGHEKIREELRMINEELNAKIEVSPLQLPFDEEDNLVLSSTNCSNFSGGKGCIFIGEVLEVPHGTPNESKGGGLLYVEGENLIFLNSSGRKVTLNSSPSASFNFSEMSFIPAPNTTTQSPRLPILFPPSAGPSTPADTSPRKEVEFMVNTPSNTFLGYSTSSTNTTGEFNTFIGASTGSINTSGCFNTFVGANAGKNNIVSHNTFIGSNAGLENTKGSGLCFIGNNAGLSNTVGNNNVYIGESTGKSSTESSHNTFVGSYSGSETISGKSNTFMGTGSGSNNVAGDNNVFIGTSSGFNNLANSNTFIGAYSGQSNNSGYNNTFLGHSSGLFSTTGIDNTFLGSNAGLWNKNGNHNIYIGSRAGYKVYNGEDNIMIGAEAVSTFTAHAEEIMEENHMVIGSLSHPINTFEIGPSKLILSDTKTIQTRDRKQLLSIPLASDSQCALRLEISFTYIHNFNLMCRMYNNVRLLAVKNSQGIVSKVLSVGENLETTSFKSKANKSTLEVEFDLEENDTDDLKLSVLNKCDKEITCKFLIHNVSTSDTVIKV